MAVAVMEAAMRMVEAVAVAAAEKEAVVMVKGGGVEVPRATAVELLVVACWVVAAMGPVAAEEVVMAAAEAKVVEGTAAVEMAVGAMVVEE